MKNEPKEDPDDGPEKLMAREWLLISLPMVLSHSSSQGAETVSIF